MSIITKIKMENVDVICYVIVGLVSVLMMTIVLWFSSNYENSIEITKLSARGSGCVLERFDSYTVVDVI